MPLSNKNNERECSNILKDHTYHNDDYFRYGHIRNAKLKIFDDQAKRTYEIIFLFLLILVLIILPAIPFVVSLSANGDIEGARNYYAFFYKKTSSVLLLIYILYLAYTYLKYKRSNLLGKNKIDNILSILLFSISEKQSAAKGEKITLFKTNVLMPMLIIIIVLIIQFVALSYCGLDSNKNLVSGFSLVKKIDSLSVGVTLKEYSESNLYFDVKSIELSNNTNGKLTNSTFFIDTVKSPTGSSIRSNVLQLVENTLRINGVYLKQHLTHPATKIDTAGLSRIVNFIETIPKDSCAHKMVVSVSNLKFSKDDLKVKDYILVLVQLTTSDIFIIWFIILFVVFRLNLKSISEECRKSHYLYFIYFLKALIVNEPTFLLGNIIFIFLTVFSVIIISLHYQITYTAFTSIGYYSFYFTIILISIFPFIKGYISFNSTYFNYSKHLIFNRILPKYKDHTIFVGIGKLGSLILRNVFFDIHTETYGYNKLSICNYKNKNIKDNDFIPDNTDYDVIIDKDLKMYLISKRVIVIEKNDSQFVSTFESQEKYQIGIFPPGTRREEDERLMVLGVCGEAEDDYILNTARINQASIILNTTTKSHLSYKLSRLTNPVKKILSVTDTPSFNSLTMSTYNRSIYLIDIEFIEGVSVSQRILLWIYKTILENGEENYFPKIRIVGNGKIIFYMLQNLILSLNHLFPKKSLLEISSIVSKNIYLLTDDEFILKELILEEDSETAGQKEHIWEFYPIRFNKMNDTYVFKIRTIYSSTYNFEDYMKMFHDADSKPNLLVILSEHNYQSTIMIIKSTNAVKAAFKNAYPNIITYSSHTEKHFVQEQLKLYFTTVLSRNETVGFPSQLPKESSLRRYYVTANQYASMLRSLLKDPQTNNSDSAILTFNIPNRPGGLSKILCWLSGVKTSNVDTPGEFIVPNFLFCYSFEHRSYKNTYIFTGTAQLERVRNTTAVDDISKSANEGNIESRQNICLICGDDHIAGVIRNSLENELTGNLEKVDYKNIDKVFKNDPISLLAQESHLKNRINENPNRLFKFNFDYGVEVLSSVHPEHAHFKIWCEGEYPGSLAESLSLILLQKIDKRKVEKEENNSLPNITFSSNYPYPCFENAERRSQVNLYVNMYSPMNNKNDIKDVLEKGVIRAVKIKKEKNILSLAFSVLEEDIWFVYSKLLFEHLGEKYNLYIIRKYYLEGTHEEILFEASEISNYHKLECSAGVCEMSYHFSIEKFLTMNSEKEIISSRVTKNNRAYFQDVVPQTYEIALIRKDIVSCVDKIRPNEKKSEFSREDMNKLIFIEDL